MPQYALGLDFGTNSLRALLVDCASGEEIATGVSAYRHGKDGLITDPSNHNVARQEPQDYFEALEKAVRSAVASAGLSVGFDGAELAGIGVATTGSTPIPTSFEGSPLTQSARFQKDINAMAWLWKDHSSYEEAEEITELAKKQGRPYLEKCGGRYSSEWFWSKILRAARQNPALLDESGNWMELCDFIPNYLCFADANVRRSICAASHKAMYSDEWGGLPARDFLATLDPRLSSLRDRLYERAFTSDQLAGGLSKAHAERWQLPKDIPVAVGMLDAHAGAVGSGVAPGRMVKIIGTSTCDILVGTGVPDIPGVAGVAEGSVLPGMTGIEAGQSAVGDIFAWWSRVCGRSQEELASEASKLKPGQSGLLALDWNNGNRNILADPLLSGLLVGQTLHTTSAEIYRALVEATAFGALTIINRIQEYGVEIKEIVACGGIAEKSPFVMQIYADVLNRRIKLSRSSETPALGAAIFGSVVGGVHADVFSAQKAMTGFKKQEYKPNRKSVELYKWLYSAYTRLHDEFGDRDKLPIMKDLVKIRALSTATRKKS